MRYPVELQRLDPSENTLGLHNYALHFIDTEPTMGQSQQTEKSDEEIDVKALQDMYKKFVQECPSGVLFLHEFKRFFGVDPTGEVSEYAECMFRAFDKNGVMRK